jgi:predicted nucleic acid-binding protein
LRYIQAAFCSKHRRVMLLAEQSSRRAELERMIHETVPSWFWDRILPITRMIAERWGVRDRKKQLAGRPLNIADGMIAAADVAGS